MAPRETENNAYAKSWGNKQRALWYVMIFLEWSIFRGFQLCLKESTFYCFTGKEYVNVTFKAYSYPERDIDLVGL